jgi:hypothetical protein
LHAELVDTHGRIADLVLISRDAKPPITAFAQYGRYVSVLIHFRNGGISRNCRRSGAHCTGNLYSLNKFIAGLRRSPRMRLGDGGIAITPRASNLGNGKSVDRGYRCPNEGKFAHDLAS